MEVRLNDAPRANEIMVAVAVTDSGRPLARVGGLTKDQIKGEYVLRKCGQVRREGQHLQTANARSAGPEDAFLCDLRVPFAIFAVKGSCFWAQIRKACNRKVRKERPQ